jgi:hypothetical protein
MNSKSLDDLASSISEANKNFSQFACQPEYETSRIRALKAARELCQRLETPLELSRRIAWQEPALIASIKIALNLGLFSQLKSCGRDKSLSTRELAQAANVDEELAARILRQLGSWGIIHETGLSQYSSTPTSDAFLEPKVASGIDYWLHLSALCFRSLPSHLHEKGYKDITNGIWERASGTDKNFWGWFADNPVAFKGFTDHLAGFSDGRAKWTSIYPVKEKLLQDAENEGPLIVDVGGGVGQDIAEFQREYPQPGGRLFVQDQPATIGEAQKSGLDPAIEAQVHDFFTPQPIIGSRAYLLHYVLHDWPDDTALKILENLKPALKKGYSKLLIVEFVVAMQNADPFNTALDMVMMAISGAKERTADDWQKLIQRAGMKVVGMWSLPGNHESVIEVISEKP